MATIKAGTYRFNDVLDVADRVTLEQDINFYNELNPRDFGYEIDAIIKVYSSNISVYWHEVDLDFNWVIYTFSHTVPDKVEVNGTSIDVVNIPDLFLLGFVDDGTIHVHKSSWGIPHWQTITIPNDTEVSTEFYDWFNENAKIYTTISGTWSINDVPTWADEHYEKVNFISNKKSYTNFNMHNGSTFEELRYYYGPSEYDEAYYNDGYDCVWHNDAYKTIAFVGEQSVSQQFADWLTTNATEDKPTAAITYNGSTIASLSSGQTATLKCAGMKMESDVVVEAGKLDTEVIDKSTAFFEDSFPSDTWNDGTYTGTVFGAPVTMRYRYRAGKEDPQNIPFVAMIQADNSDFEQTENLADFYLKTAALYCGRIEATTTGDCLSCILYENPVVPTFYDMSQLYSADIGMPCYVTLNATHCGIRNYDGISYADIGCMDTVVTYAVETDLRPEEIGYSSVAHALYMVPLRLAWYHESNFAFGGLEYKDYPKPVESVTENGDYYWWPTDGYSGVNHVRVTVQPRLQEKIMVGKGEVVADEGYYGLSKVTVTTDGGLLYQIPEPTYFDGNMLPIDTGVRLFDTARDFTILMDVTSEGNGCLIHCQNPNNDGIIVMQSTYDTRPDQWMVRYNGLLTFIDCSPLSANRYRFVIVGNTLPEYSVFVGNVTEGNAEVDCSDRANSHRVVEPFTETANFGGVKISEGAYTNLWKGTFHDLKILGRAVGQIERQMYLETGEIVM